MSLTEKIQIEEKIYNCPSKNHLGSDRRLFTLNYLNSHISDYRFCEPCSALYSVEKGTPVYVDVDDTYNLPIFFYINKNNETKQLDPITLTDGEAD